MARISPGTMTAAIFAILVGLAGAYAVRQYLKEAPVVERAEAAPEMFYVPIASSDLMAGRQLTVNDITMMSMTLEQLQQSPYANLPCMQDKRQIARRVLKDERRKGSAFLTTDLYPEGMGPGIAELLKSGQRAVTVAIENVGAVEGYARPGTIVDVLFRSAPDESRPEVTITLLEAVNVLAVGKMSVPGHEIGSPQATEKTTVTLGVTPEQVKIAKRDDKVIRDFLSDYYSNFKPNKLRYRHRLCGGRGTLGTEFCAECGGSGTGINLHHFKKAFWTSYTPLLRNADGAFMALEAFYGHARGKPEVLGPTVKSFRVREIEYQGVWAKARVELNTDDGAVEQVVTLVSIGSQWFFYHPDTDRELLPVEVPQ